MVVLLVKKIIVLACEKGLVFSPIPDPGGLYKFSFADIPRPTRYSATAKGIDETIVAGIWGNGNSPNFGFGTNSKSEVRAPTDGCINLARQASESDN
jgi:hypothetical protein